MIKLINGLDPQVLAKMINAKLEKKIRFDKVAVIDKTLQGRPGTTITIPSYSYIGDADDLTEGVPMVPADFSVSTKQYTIKQIGKAAEITDLNLNSSYGNAKDEATNQIALAIAAKIDNDLYEAAKTAPTVFDNSANIIGYEPIVDAVALFAEENEIDEDKFIIIHSLQEAQLRKDPNFIKATDLGESVKTNGAIGKIAGCYIIVSNKIGEGTPGDGLYLNPIIKKGALKLFLKQDLKIEVDRDILAKTTVIAGDKYYVASLVDEKKIVLMKNKQTV